MLLVSDCIAFACWWQAAKDASGTTASARAVSLSDALPEDGTGAAPTSTPATSVAPGAGSAGGAGGAASAAVAAPPAAPAPASTAAALGPGASLEDLVGLLKRQIDASDWVAAQPRGERIWGDSDSDSEK
jgi:hypothetical protein